MTWTESASMHINDKDNSEFFSRIINTMFEIFSCLCLGIIAFMPIVFPVMINSAYNEAYNQIPILMLGALANVGIGLISVVYIAKKKTKEVAKISVCAAIINIVVNLLLINFIGLYAASISTFVAYLSMLIYRIFDVKKYVNLKVNKMMLIRTIIMLIILVVIYYINNIILNIFSIIITIIYCIIVNKNNIKFMIDMITSKFNKGST